ncbi:hypothetical protein Hdeb2414_s1149g00985831 [Helianthus debilis subsp. tardiflorus]
MYMYTQLYVCVYVYMLVCTCVCICICGSMHMVMCIWRTTRVATQKDIDQLLRIIMPWFLVRMFPNWSHAFK